MPSSASSGDPKARDSQPLHPPSSRPRSQRQKTQRIIARLSTLIGIGLAVAGAGFVIDRMVAGWSDYGDVIVLANWSWLLAAVAVAIVGMSAMGLVWRSIIRALGATATRREVFSWYQLGSLGKYVPGGLWPLVGRSELAVRGGLSRPIAYNSVALSMGMSYLCAALMCALLLPFVLIGQSGSSVRPWAFALAPLGLAFLHPAVLGPMLRIAERLLGKGVSPTVPTWWTSVGLVLRHALPWLAIGVATWLVALGCGADAPVPTLLFATILSWVVGFLVVPVPGGFGVREAAFTAVASLAMPSQLAATVAVASRLVFMAADGAGAAVAVLLSARRRGSQSGAAAPDRPVQELETA